VSKFVLTAQLQLKAPNNVSQVVSQMQKQLSGVSVNLNAQGAVKANQQVQQLSSNLNQASKSAKGLGSDFAQSVRRFSAMAIATRAVSLFTNTLSSAIKESIAFERELVKISQVTGQTVQNLSFLTNTVSSLSTNLGVASGSLLSVSRMLSQAGLSAKETETALRTLAMTDLAPTFDNIAQTAEGAIAIFNQFGKGAAALEQQLGAVNAVAGQFAVESGDLIAAVRRTGGVFRAAGGDLNELIALFTSVRSTTRESAESISTGLRTIFTRIQRPKTIEFMKKFGVELTDMEGKFVGPFEAVKRLSAALAGLEQGDTRFIKIAEELGGFRQIGKVIPLIQQFSTAQSALNVAQAGGNSLAKDAATAQQALAVQIIKVKEQFLELIRGVTATPIFQMMATSALTLASALIKVADTLKPILPIITAIAAVKFTKGIAGFMGGLAGNMKGFSQGGKVHAFARGGVVPGSGNRDTVPAMLTPGEFVIRKSSVAKLGAGNLEGMNKYAAGGMVSQDRHTYGPKAPPAIKRMKVAPKVSPEEQKRINEKGAATRAENEAKRKQGEEFDGETTKDNSGKKLPTIGLAALHGTNKLYDQAIPNIGKRVKLQFSTLDPKQAKGYEREMRDSVESVAGKMASELATDIRDSTPINQSEIDGMMDKAGFANAVGAFFESALALTGSPYEGAKGKMQINDSLDFASGLGTAAKSFKGLTSNMPTDATRTAGSEGKSASKFASQVGRWFAKNPNYDIDLVKKMAEGGGVGSDTVPALLTPGEFVVNKSSAQKIGYGSLNRMNKVGKYAKGGFVQKFAGGSSGSGVKGGGGGMMGGMFEGMTGQLMGVQMALSMLTPAIDENSGAFARGANSLMGGFNSLIGVVTMAQVALAAFGVNLQKQNIGSLLKSMFKTGRGGLGDIIGGVQKRKVGGKLRAVRRKGEGFSEAFQNEIGVQKERASINKKMRNVRKSAPQKNFVESPAAQQQTQIKRKRRADSLRNLRSQKLSLKSASPTSITGQLGKKAAGSPMLQGALKKLSGPLQTLGTKLPTFTAGLQGAIGAVGPLAGHLTAVAGPALAAAGAMKLVLGSFDAVTGRTETLNKAIEEGNVAQAEKVAFDKAGAEAVTNLAAGLTAAGGLIGGPFGAAIGAATGAVLKVASEMPVIGPVVMEAAGFISQAFGGKSLSSIVALAGANAAANKATKDLAKAQTAAKNATEDFQNGTLSASEALAKIQQSTASVTQSENKAKKAVQENSKNKSADGFFNSGVGPSGRDIASFVSFGMVDSSTTRDKKIDDENKGAMQTAMKQDAERFQMTKGLKMSTAKSVFATGGDMDEAAKAVGIEDSVDPTTGKVKKGLRSKQLETVQEAEALKASGDEEGAKILMQAAKQTEEQILDLERSLENLQKSVIEQQKAFAAMNLGLNSAQGAAGAFSDAMKNYQASQEAGNVGVMRNFATLEAGIGKAAAGMDPKVFQSALSETSDALKSFGADDAQIKKFEENISAVNASAQANAQAGLEKFRQNSD